MEKIRISLSVDKNIKEEAMVKLKQRGYKLSSYFELKLKELIQEEN